MILATALEQSLRMSAATTASTGTLVLRISVGILLALAPCSASALPSPCACAAGSLVDRRRGERVEDEGYRIAERGTGGGEDGWAAHRIATIGPQFRYSSWWA